jgi:hypothetical protein
MCRRFTTRSRVANRVVPIRRIVITAWQGVSMGIRAPRRLTAADRLEIRREVACNPNVDRALTSFLNAHPEYRTDEPRATLHRSAN